MTALRIFFVGGLISFRALFSFLRPEIYIPSMLVAPIFQILLFVVHRPVGRPRVRRVLRDRERRAVRRDPVPLRDDVHGRRGALPADARLHPREPRAAAAALPRRALPVIVNGFFVAAFSLVVGGLIVGIDVPASSLAPLALATASARSRARASGSRAPAIGLLLREQAVLANIMFGVLLVFTGANVPGRPAAGWMQPISNVLPFTHGIEAARQVADGASLSDVAACSRRRRRSASPTARSDTSSSGTPSG